MPQRPHKKITIYEKKTKYSRKRRIPRKELITKELNARIVDEFIENYGDRAKQKKNKK